MSINININIVVVRRFAVWHEPGGVVPAKTTRQSPNPYVYTRDLKTIFPLAP